MKRLYCILCRLGVVVIIHAIGGASLVCAQIRWEAQREITTEVTAVLVAADHPQQIFAGTNGSVLKTENAGGNWQYSLLLKGSNKTVYCLIFDPRDRRSIYAATGSGLYRSLDSGKHWQRIKKGRNYLEQSCTAVRVMPYAIYVGTKAGLWFSRDFGKTWHRERSVLGRSCISAIAYDKKDTATAYVATNEGIFRTQDEGVSWVRVMIRTHACEESEGQDYASTQKETETEHMLYEYVYIDPHNSHIYIAGSKGIYKSQDRGKQWSLIDEYGFYDKKIICLTSDDTGSLYALTPERLLRYQGGTWQDLSMSVAAGKYAMMDKDNFGNFYLAASKGLFKGIAQASGNNGSNKESMAGPKGPTVNEVQNVAIQYAEAEPEKIMIWRKKAALKASMPEISLGVSRNVTDLWHWESGSTTKTDDDELKRGKDAVEWAVTLRWDLSELIWSSDQTAIDVRSRLTAELRENIVDQVTKLYFERIRVARELAHLSLESKDMRFDKELKLREITASLDGFTGGYFSRTLRE